MKNRNTILIENGELPAYGSSPRNAEFEGVRMENKKSHITICSKTSVKKVDLFERKVRLRT
jgi:hypothetical protein